MVRVRVRVKIYLVIVFCPVLKLGIPLEQYIDQDIDHRAIVEQAHVA